MKPAILGVAIILIASFIEGLHPTAPTNDYASILEMMKSQHFWIARMGELGGACVIAAIVTFFIESGARKEQTRLFDSALKVIGNQVVRGVYGVRHENSYVQAVVATCLAVFHIRKNYRVSCHVLEFTPEERTEYGITDPDLVKVTADVKYESWNISSRPVTFEGRYFIPKRFDKVGDYSRMTFLSVGDRIFDTAEKLKLLELCAGHEHHVETDIGYEFEIPAYPLEPTHVHIKTQFAKERQGNEIFTFLLPTIGAYIRFYFELRSMSIGAKARAASDAVKEETVPGREIEWQTLGPLLPNNHVTVFWSKSDGKDGSHGEASPSEDIEEAEPTSPALLGVQPMNQHDRSHFEDVQNGTDMTRSRLQQLYEDATAAITRLVRWRPSG